MVVMAFKRAEGRNSAMVEMNYVQTPQLAEAVRIWTGYGSEMMPSRDDARLVNCVGEVLADKLLSVIRFLEEDFYSSDVRHVAANLQQMGELASAHFKQRHPMVAEDIVKAFAWCYTFDFR